jgi:hypothetical protein
VIYNRFTRGATLTPKVLIYGRRAQRMVIEFE